MIDQKILVGYIENFEFTKPESLENLSGHPKVGRIYQLFQIDGCYMVHIGAKNTAGHLEGIALGEELIGNYEDKWKFTVIPVNMDNYLNFELHEEDLKSLLAWLENDHAELRRLLGLPIVPVSVDKEVVKQGDTSELQFYDHNNKPIAPPSKEELSHLKELITNSIMGNAVENRRRIIDEISNSLNFLMDTDPLLVEILNDLFTHLAATYKDKYSDENTPNISKDIQFSTSLGKGANIYSAVKHIQAYSTTGFEGSEKQESLLAAIHYCLFELQRRKLHE